MDRHATTRHALALAQEQGFALSGVAPASPSPHADYVRRWIASGRHGEMRYLAEHLDVRLDPGRIVEGARAVIVVADRYPAQAPREQTASDAEPRGRIARYAWGEDYHKLIKKRLHALADALGQQFPDQRFRAAVDTAPVMEREHAVAAGLGWVGKHTLMIHPRHGSWFCLGVIITTLDCAPSDERRGSANPPAWDASGGDHCGTCTRCIDACPTDAIAPEGYKLDATRCISYLTLEHRSTIPADLHRGMADWIAGCDICQEVCPYNRSQGSGVRDQALPIHPRYAPRNTSLPLLEVLGWTAEDRAEHFRGSALKRMKLPMVKRNALIAAGNALREAKAPALRARIERIAADETEDDLVRDTARQVLAPNSA